MQQNMFDVVIVGGGLLGRTLAWRLGQAGASVAVVSEGAPASQAAAGMLAPSFEALHHRACPDLIPLLHTALGRWPAFATEVEGESGDDIDFQMKGIIGLDLGERLSGSKLIEAPTEFIAGHAQVMPGEGQVDPRRLIKALQKRACLLGIQDIKEKALCYQSSGQEVAVELSRSGRLLSGQVILATGATPLIEPSGTPHPIPVRGRAFLVRPRASLPQTVIRYTNAYFCPKADGTVYVGATEEEEGGSDQTALNALWTQACSYWPALAEAEVLARFDGERPASPTGMPVIKSLDEAGRVLLATGLDRNGVLLTPWCTDQVLSFMDAGSSGVMALEA